MTNARDPQLTDAAEKFVATFQGLSLAELEAKPSPDVWSRRQVVEHILLTYRSTVGTMEHRLAKGSPTDRPRTLLARGWQFLLIRCGYFPAGRKAPEIVDPVKHPLPPGDGAALAAEYWRQLAEMEAAIGKVEAAWGNKIAVATHQRLGPLSTWQWLRFHAVHTRHHTKQMERIAQAVAR
jgi:hypothetical protein